VARIGLLADKLLLAGEFDHAVKFAEEAIAEGETPFWVAPQRPIPITVENTTWISAIRAHALMFLGRVDEARVFYLIFQSNRRFVMTLWETAILQDFVQLRKAGHSHPLMDQIEKRFADQGWTTERGNKQVLRPVMSGQDRLFVDSHPDHIKSGDLLDQHDEPQRAIAVYVRHLERCQAKMKLAGVTGAGEANLQTAIGRLKGIAEKLLRDKQFALAVECSERALEVLPDNREFQAIRAKAKMLERETLDRPSSIFQQRDENIGNKSWGFASADGNTDRSAPVWMSLRWTLAWV
jgi:tetratricopeptide (TPR) repeat protein